MISVSPLRPVIFVALLPAVIFLACASSVTPDSPTTPREAATGAPAPGAPSEPSAPSMAAEGEGREPEPEPEREWLTDSTGRRYYVETYPKSYAHRRIDERHIRTVWGPTIEVEREDETSFYYRVYEVDRGTGAPLKPEGPTPEQRASYEVEVPRVDRVAFAPFDTGLPRAGQWRNGFAIADLDGDGHLDIAHGAPRKGGRGPAMFLGDGAGGWRRWQAQFPSFPYDYGDVAVGDLDGDGRADVVFGVHLKGLVALVQQEPGRFALWNEGLPWWREGEAPGFSTRAVDLVDWNEDGRLDVLALGEGPTMQVSRDSATAGSPALGVRVFLNLGSGKWRGEHVLEPSTGVFGDQLALADFDDDGRLDALLGVNTMGVSGVLVRGAAPQDSRQLHLDPFRARTYARAVTGADLDGDGDRDLAVAFMSHELLEWKSGIDVYLRRGDGGWDRRLVYVEDGNRGLWALDAADLDGDQRTDLVAATGDGEIVVLLGEGGGGFGRNPGPALAAARGCRGYHVRLADLDRDGRSDLVVGFAGERSGLPGVVQNPGCTDEGSLRAWRSVPAGGRRSG